MRSRSMARRRQTSLVFQAPVLFPWRSVISNVLFPIEIFKRDRKSYYDEAIKLLQITGLQEFKDRLPEQLSGGMAQRVSLCRALITDPELLLMDEPFSALDALTRDDMGLELQQIWEQYRKTVIFVTHSIREAVFLSDRVIVSRRDPPSWRAIFGSSFPAADARGAGDAGIQPSLRRSIRASLGR